MKRDNENIVNYVKRSLADNCLLSPMCENLSFDVLPFYLKK